MALSRGCVVTGWDIAKQFIADLARPFSIIVTSASAAVVPVIVVARMAPDRFDLIGAAAFVGALYAGVAGLYWGKAIEETRKAGQAAEVEKVRAQAVAPPAEALKPAEPDAREEEAMPWPPR